jgi:hypothetical protein
MPALVNDPVLNRLIIVGVGTDTRITFAALLNGLPASANTATAVTLFPILRRRNEDDARGATADCSATELRMLDLVVRALVCQQYASAEQDAAAQMAAEWR